MCPNETVPLQIDRSIGPGRYLLVRSANPRARNRCSRAIAALAHLPSSVVPGGPGRSSGDRRVEPALRQPARWVSGGGQRVDHLLHRLAVAIAGRGPGSTSLRDPVLGEPTAVASAQRSIRIVVRKLSVCPNLIVPRQLELAIGDRRYLFGCSGTVRPGTDVDYSDPPLPSSSPGHSHGPAPWPARKVRRRRPGWASRARVGSLSPARERFATQ